MQGGSNHFEEDGSKKVDGRDREEIFKFHVRYK